MGKKITHKRAHLSHSEIIGNSGNPRYIKDDKFEKLLNSIKEFPDMLEVRPITVDESYMVLGGNMRLRACKELKLEKIPVLIVKGWSEEKKRQFIIKDNASFGEWDWDILGNEWDAEELIEWGIDIAGFETEEEEDKEEPTEEVNFNIVCENLEELNLLQNRLNASGKNMSYSKFIELI